MTEPKKFLAPDEVEALKKAWSELTPQEKEQHQALDIWRDETGAKLRKVLDAMELPNDALDNQQMFAACRLVATYVAEFENVEKAMELVNLVISTEAHCIVDDGGDEPALTTPGTGTVN